VTTDLIESSTEW